MQLWSVKYVCNRGFSNSTIRPCRRRRLVASWRSACGAEQKHVTLPSDFRSPPQNSHSRYDDQTAVAPKPPLAATPNSYLETDPPVPEGIAMFMLAV